MRFHSDDEINGLIGVRVWCFRGEAKPFTMERGPRQTVAEIVEEIKMLYGSVAARMVKLTIH
jgi:hypothetical protein